ncbi:NUDIX domain-containing protein [Gephyromycinifex aptenodytis]|uniref:NUDIX domain-containing protein n=1 Tax=Gephyromycinifex aptenodytis TaxID=2716227 RepID=UPI0014473280|nr:NUDIX hydrolase [Gephyromycinifex aptenodytis]
MTLDAQQLDGSDLHDEYRSRPVKASRTVYEGMVWDVRRDTVDLGHAVVDREFIEHPGAVVIVALRRVDGADQVFMLRQYRHTIGASEWELPAGLLDVEGEPPWRAAARELNEEADLVAAQWHTLVDFHPSAGALSEVIRVYLARDLSDVPGAQRHTRRAEEADMSTAWVDLDQAHSAVLAGQIGNAGAIVGILSAHAARAAGWSTLRAHDTPFNRHPKHRVNDQG